MDIIELKKKIEEIMKEKKISKYKLARLTGIHDQYLGYFFKNHNNKIDTIEKIIEPLGYELDLNIKEIDNENN